MQELTELRQLIGMEAVLIHLPLGSKGSPVGREKVKPWGHRSAKDMENPCYLKKLLFCNIGVIHGKRSGGLNCIDIDDPSLTPRFLDANPWAKDSFTVVGKEGRCKIFVKSVGDYPKSRTSNTPIEWRADCEGGPIQSVIVGLHPDIKDHYYKITVAKKPAEIEYKDIDFIGYGAKEESPELLAEVWSGTQDSKESQDSNDSHDSDDSKAVLSPSHCFSFSELLAATAPTAEHQTNKLLFEYARGIRAIEQSQGTRFTREQLVDAFNQWHANYSQFAKKPKEDYLIEFLAGYNKVRYPTGDVLNRAWAASEKEIPPEANSIESTDIKRLIALCYHLQQAAGSRPFFLSTRVVQRLFKLPAHTKADRWLHAISALGVITMHERGKLEGRKATCWRYISTNP